MNIVLLQFLNYTLSFLMWMLIGRVALILIIGPRDNVFLALFEKVANPVHRLVRRLLPIFPEGWTPFVSILFILALRLTLVLALQPPAKP